MTGPRRHRRRQQATWLCLVLGGGLWAAGGLLTDPGPAQAQTNAGVVTLRIVFEGYAAGFGR